MRRASCLLPLLLTAATARAHDLWIIPDSFRPPPGAVVGVELRVGEVFPTSMNAPSRQTLRRFALVSSAGETPILELGEGAKVLTGRLTAPAAGTAAIVLEGPPRHIVLKPDQFKDYLLHEGLPHIHEERVRKGEADRPGREDYSRHAKALLRGAPGEGVGTRATGLELEAVPGLDPYDLAPGQPLPVTVLFRGKPLPGIELRAYTVGGAAARAKTGGDGTATVAIDRPGPWCIAFIHMERCVGCADADWRSYFGTLTFESRAGR